MSNRDAPPPASKLIDWAALVRKAWGPAFNEPDTAYQFSNGREFKSTDGNHGGIYDGTGS